MRTTALLCVALAAAYVAARPAYTRGIAPDLSLWTEAERDSWCSHSGILSPQCGGFIGGVVWADAPTNCSFVLLDNETDKTRVVDAVPPVCADHKRAVPDADEPAATMSAVTGFTAFDTPTKQILFASADGATLWGVSVMPGKGQGYKALATLPAAMAPLIGLAVANGIGDQGQWYVVTTDVLYSVDATSGAIASVMDLDTLRLSDTARVTAFNQSMYILDGLRAHSIDLTLYSAASVTLTDASLATANTIQWWPTNNTLVTVSASRVVTQIELSTGRSWPVMPALAGSGTIDRSTSFFDMYFITDSENMYLINLAAKTLEVTAPWPGATTIGMIQYYY